jgi:hypothetical protein
MRKFLYNIFLLGLLFSVLISVTFMICYKMSSKKIDWTLETSKTVLITGDSYPECALDDSIMTETVNLSSSADTYVYSYVKIRKFIIHNPQIRTVVLGFSYHNLLSSDDSFFKNTSPGISKFVKYFYLMDPNEIRALLRANCNIIIKGLGSCYRQAVFFALTSFKGSSYKKLSLGGYRRLSVNKVKEILSGTKKTEPGIPVQIDSSQVQIRYLNKVVQLCKEKNIRLILLNVPIHREFQKTLKNEKAFFDQFCRQNQILDYLWDYADYSLPDSCYSDPEHLNYHGAENFSLMIRKELGKLDGNEKNIKSLNDTKYEDN